MFDRSASSLNNLTCKYVEGHPAGYKGVKRDCGVKSDRI
jgi:hypothetical protein